MDNLIKDIYNLIYEKLDINDLKFINLLSKKFHKTVPLKNSTFIVNEINQIKKYIPYIKKCYVTPGILDEKNNIHTCLIEYKRNNMAIPHKYTIFDANYEIQLPNCLIQMELLLKNSVLMQFYLKN